MFSRTWVCVLTQQNLQMRRTHTILPERCSELDLCAQLHVMKNSYCNNQFNMSVFMLLTHTVIQLPVHEAMGFHIWCELQEHFGGKPSQHILTRNWICKQHHSSCQPADVPISGKTRLQKKVSKCVQTPLSIISSLCCTTPTPKKLGRCVKSEYKHNSINRNKLCLLTTLLRSVPEPM